MSGGRYWKDRLPLLLVHLLAMAALSFFLVLSGLGADGVLLILLAWVLLAGGWLLGGYLRRKRELDALLALARDLPETYLLGEVMDPPARAEDQVYHRLLKLAGRAMLEQVSQAGRERREYKEYVEQWVHEVKTPIAALKLLCENHPSQTTQAQLLALESIDHYTEQALFYARSEQAEKDYAVRELRLTDAVHRAIAQNKHLLLQKRVRLEVAESDARVFSDEKWLCFILSQLIGNAVKYAGEDPRLTFTTAQAGGWVALRLEDNGIGIPAADLPRIFDKGFTGENGRQAAQNATGLGLYLCRRLCDKLDIGLTAASPGPGQGTTLTLSFRVNHFIRQVQ